MRQTLCLSNGAGRHSYNVSRSCTLAVNVPKDFPWTGILHTQIPSVTRGMLEDHAPKFDPRRKSWRGKLRYRAPAKIQAFRLGKPVKYY